MTLDFGLFGSLVSSNVECASFVLPSTGSGWLLGTGTVPGFRSRDAESLQIAAAVLSVFGFQHFALTQGDDGMELVPADAMASNEMIFSLEPSFLMRFTT